MPRQAKGPYLWFRKERRDKSGKLISSGHWVIIDNRKHITTKCAKAQIEQAQEELRRYSQAKYEPSRKGGNIDTTQIADVLLIYLDDKQANTGRIERLNEFWGHMVLADVNRATCEAYVQHRGNKQGARRDLEDLRAAINHHAKVVGRKNETVIVSLPKREPSRDKWLTRSELARLLWVCLTHREMQNGKPTKKRPLRHLARFILIGYYTGTRHSAVLTASFTKGPGRSFMDLERGLFYRLAEGKEQTKKRQPPVRISQGLMPHLKRWAKTDSDFIVTFKGKPLASVKNSFRRCAELAGIEDITPHVLRHTTATHLMQAGTDKWETAGFLGMSVEMLERVYGHHHPDFMSGAASAL